MWLWIKHAEPAECLLIGDHSGTVRMDNRTANRNLKLSVNGASKSIWHPSAAACCALTTLPSCGSVHLNPSNTDSCTCKSQNVSGTNAALDKRLFNSSSRCEYTGHICKIHLRFWLVVITFKLWSAQVSSCDVSVRSNFTVQDTIHVCRSWACCRTSLGLRHVNRSLLKDRNWQVQFSFSISVWFVWTFRSLLTPGAVRSSSAEPCGETEQHSLWIFNFNILDLIFIISEPKAERKYHQCT